MAPHSPADFNLAFAVVDASNAPLLLLDGDLTVLAASKSFSDTFRVPPARLAGLGLGALGSGEWNTPQLESLLTATAAGDAEVDAYEMDLRREGEETRRLVVNAHKLHYDGNNIRLLLAITDVTDARLSDRLKDDLLREKTILLQELQHRVANSLQIIASVLMQSSRKMQSGEIRTHLYDAHQRVMSIATLQQQLSVSTLHEVDLHAYFTSLCRTLGASMISDHDQLVLKVNADESVASSDVSVSLGLIVTELVINALKHAFPRHRHGAIQVDYVSRGPEWTLSVSDNGVGMPPETAMTPGLGASIVQALASKLHAEVVITDNGPGTRVSIVHI